MRMVEISFLIPTYNQSLDLAKCISAIVAYKGSDIEIVVNDDCSEENLNLVVDSFQDKRIRCCRNDKNLGLDGNILSGIKNCYGKYIFLLRTRDFVISDAIPSIISITKNHPDVVYITGTCLDDDGLLRTCYDNEICVKGESALHVHDLLHSHPSGSVFKRSEIDVEKYQRYLERFPEPRLWFMVDQLIRLDLAQKGDFCLIREPIWVYTYTSRNKKRSVHPTKNGHLYTQKNTFLRFQSEMEFVIHEFAGEWISKRLIKTFQFWLNQATWGYLDTMSDRGLMDHYGIEPEIVDIESERIKFLEYTKRVENNLGIVDDTYLRLKKKVIQENIEYAIQKKKMDDNRLKVQEISQPIVKQIEKMKISGDSLASCIERKGFRRVGIYGMGYLGRMVWNELRCSKKVQIVFVCDKQYKNERSMTNGIYAIPPDKIHFYDIDVLLVTPVQYIREIQREVCCVAPKITIMDLLEK